jgi:60 kDa SS-A/Ro ribonucleoprotein
MSKYSRIRLSTPQTQPVDPRQVPNSGGGYGFALDCWARLDRFLILGSDAPTYYASAQKLTAENSKAVWDCLREDGPRVVRRIVEISDAGRAPKNDPAIYALAIAASDSNPVTRAAAFAALQRVCRVGTHLFHFCEDVNAMRGWGRGLRAAVAAWYTSKTPDALAYQVVKYQQRDGWGHRDVLRLCHAKAPSPPQNAVLNYAVNGFGERRAPHQGAKRHAILESLPEIIEGMSQAHAQGASPRDVAEIVSRFRLPWECVPSDNLKSPEVWAALLPHMGLGALMRNLGRLSSLGMTGPMCQRGLEIAARLVDAKALRKARIHPFNVLMALTTYAAGRGVKGGLTWQPNREINEALDEAFHQSFENVTPSGKRTLLALDVSGSMQSSMNGSHLTCAQATAALALVTARVEPHWHMIAFSNGISQIQVEKSANLQGVIRSLSGLPFGNTDCAAPMIYAARQGIPVDVFVVLTDSETNSNSMHPHLAMQKYRKESGISDSKLVVVAMTSARFSIADPSDSNMLDVVGFDAATPRLISEFAAGWNGTVGKPQSLGADDE